MKYHDINKRNKWEIAFRKMNPDARQLYYLCKDIIKDQDSIEKQIKVYRKDGRRLKKRMRNYLKDKSKLILRNKLSNISLDNFKPIIDEKKSRRKRRLRNK